ncbi:MAG: pyridoxamine 5'-phosphate oxidase family protein [Solirubrobacterales bacterium]|nr:pyridoxamine 5'-phosphate oxidase family protein [Solirubrobacterales bacterium]
MSTETKNDRDLKAVIGVHDAAADTEIPDVAPIAFGGTRRSAAEESRTILANATHGTLGTLSDDGTPWASLVTFGVMDDGSPVFCLSTLAEHARNLEQRRQASLMVSDRFHSGEILAGGRVTLAGKVKRSDEHPDGASARAAHLEAVPSAAMYADFNDFSFWILEVDRVRWVGGYGRMDSASADDYRSAEPDPVQPQVPDAVAHLNADHPDALLIMAKAFTKYTDATEAKCTLADRYGLDLQLETPEGEKAARVSFADRIDKPGGLRAATVDLARRSREKLAS